MDVKLIANKALGRVEPGLTVCLVVGSPPMRWGLSTSENMVWTDGQPSGRVVDVRHVDDALAMVGYARASGWSTSGITQGECSEPDCPGCLMEAPWRSVLRAHVRKL
jgi:hypothetical protein